MRKRHERNTQWLESFQTALDIYAEVKSKVGTSGAFNYASLEQEGTGKNYNPRVVQPMPIDFVCEIEIAARRALGTEGVLIDHFRKFYINGEDSANFKKLPLWQKIDHQVRLKVGREIFVRRLYNYSGYMKPKWVDRYEQ